MNIIDEVKALNSKAKELNAQSERARWEKDRAKKQLTEALTAYNEKYGVSLTADDIKSEYAKVEQEVQVKAEALRGEIAKIERGEYSEGVTATPTPMPTPMPTPIQASTPIQAPTPTPISTPIQAPTPTPQSPVTPSPTVSPLSPTPMGQQTLGGDTSFDFFGDSDFNGGFLGGFGDVDDIDSGNDIGNRVQEPQAPTQTTPAGFDFSKYLN